MSAFRENPRPLATGVYASLTASVCWGLFPVLWSWLRGAGDLEIIAHRLLWSGLTLLFVLALRGRLPASLRAISDLWRRQRGVVGLLALAALASALNYLVHVLAVRYGRVVETSIGMFLTPLLSVLFGALLYRERLPLAKWLCLAPAAIGLLLLLSGYGRFPWFALGVSLSWASYSALKKKIRLDPWTGVLFETLLLSPFALTYLIGLAAVGQSSFGPGAPAFSALLVSVGPLTVLPLVIFTYAASTLPLNMLGILQYANPVLIMATGVFLLGERFNPIFAWPLFLILVSLTLFTAQELRRPR